MRATKRKQNLDTGNTQGFVDSASLHGAFAALILGKPESWTEWDRQSLLECTYLLLFNNMSIVPGPRLSGKAAYGYETEVVGKMPKLLTGDGDRREAEQRIRWWLARYPERLKRAWEDLKNDPRVDDWSNYRREFFWENHIRGRDGLFSLEYASHLARVLGCSEADLRKVHALSTDLKQVKLWAKGHMDAAAELADAAYRLSSLISGKYHEYLARTAGLQLVSHPHRAVISIPIPMKVSILSTNSEQCFIKMIIGSALLESTAKRRIHCWIDNIRKARDAIDLKAISLRQCTLDADAESQAVAAARRIELPGSSSLQRDILTSAATLNLSFWLSMVLGPWAFLGLGIPFLYKQKRQVTIGEDLARVGTTRRNFLRLGRSVPGRIERTLLPAPAVMRGN